ncbi:MAG: MFS transporter [Planctomycetota bacterium]
MTSSPAPSASRSTLGIVFMIVFLDIAGFSIIFPLFPKLLEHYVAQEGADSAVGRLAEWLHGLAGRDENAVVTLFGGLLGSLYGLMQFVFSPIWGGWSDRVGRRHTLVVTMLGTALSYVAWTFAGSFALLVAARLLGGVMAGNISTAAAVAADTTSGKDRAKGMGIVGMAIGLGFILGPALGGISMAEPLRLDHALPGLQQLGPFGLNPFSTPAVVALVLCLLNFVWMLRRLPETLPPERRGAHPGTLSVLRPFHRLKSLEYPGVARAHWIYFVQLLAFAAMEFTLTFLAAERLDYGIGQITWMFVFSGFVIAMVQGGGAHRMVKKRGERKVATLGMSIMLPGYLVTGFADSTWMLYVGLFLLSAGSGFTMPAMSALVSRYVPADKQGLAQGTLRSLGSLSRASGPVLGGLMYWKFGSAVPYWVGALMTLWPILACRTLPEIAEA